MDYIGSVEYTEKERIWESTQFPYSNVKRESEPLVILKRASLGILRRSQNCRFNARAFLYIHHTYTQNMKQERERERVGLSRGIIQVARVAHLQILTTTTTTITNNMNWNIYLDGYRLLLKPMCQTSKVSQYNMAMPVFLLLLIIYCPCECHEKHCDNIPEKTQKKIDEESALRDGRSMSSSLSFLLFRPGWNFQVTFPTDQTTKIYFFLYNSSVVKFQDHFFNFFLFQFYSIEF